MAKRKIPSNRIGSAAEALNLAQTLPSIWSQESYLELRVVIYCAELLEQIERNQRETILAIRRLGRPALPNPVTSVAGSTEIARASIIPNEPEEGTDDGAAGSE